MISIEKIKVEGWEQAIRGMRNPLDSWEKSDSLFYDFADDQNFEVYCHDINGGVKVFHPYEMDDWGYGRFNIGPNDLDLMMKLAKSGTEHAKYRRMIVVWMDITAPLYWWKEFDTYKVGTVADSCSTMHTIANKEFTPDDFSCEHLIDVADTLNDLRDENVDANNFIDYAYKNNNNVPIVFTGCDSVLSPNGILNITILMLNNCRGLYLKTKDKKYWWQLIQLLPSSYNQKRTVMLNYEVLANIYRQRRNHKLDEWHAFCKMIEKKMPYSKLITLKEEEQ